MQGKGLSFDVKNYVQKHWGELGAVFFPFITLVYALVYPPLNIPTSLAYQPWKGPGTRHIPRRDLGPGIHPLWTE